MRRRSRTLTEQELEIMKIVWRLQRATVRDVYEVLRARRKIAYTTVMTMMHILEEKGHLRKRAEERAYVYQATRPRGEVIKAMVRDFVDRVFNGSAQPLLVHLLKNRRLSQKDLEKIARAIREGE